MSGPTLTIGPRIFERFPGVRVGVVAAHGVDNSTGDPEIPALLEEEQRRAVAELAGVTVVEHPHVAPWRDAYRGFGAKPKKYRSSIENLVRRVLKGQALPSIGPLVDLYNVVSLRHLLPVGGEDLECTVGPIRLTFAATASPPVCCSANASPGCPIPAK